MSKLNELKHLAIIMDGNGRYAQRYGKARNFGHEKGAKKLRQIIQYVAKTSISYLTLYAFSTENWSRPISEINALMKLLEGYLVKERDNLLKNDIRFKVIGDVSVFSTNLQEQIKKSEQISKNGKTLTQFLALNYGSRDEIVRAVKSIMKEKKEISEENISFHLDTENAPDVDLLIRTGGEQRLSNYLLWQSSYAELFFTPTLWPEFTCEELESIIERYKCIDRRFGGL